jgi:hypothetical protein
MEAETERRMGAAMTDKERRKLCADLDGISYDEKGVDDYIAERCLAAADELKRLAEELQYQHACDRAQQREIERLTTLAQPDAEPVAARIAELEREIYTLRADLVECADTLSAQQFNQAQQKRIEACRAELAALAQPDAEPVAWVVKHAGGFGGGFTFTTTNEAAAQAYAQKHQQFSVSPLYAAPPRPDTAAGLIEAAEIAEEWDSGWGEDRNTGVARQTAIEIAAALRARAADRNGPADYISIGGAGNGA